MLQVVTTALGVVRHRKFHRERRISTLNLQLQLQQSPFSRNLLTCRNLWNFTDVSLSFKGRRTIGSSVSPRLILPFPICSPPILVPAILSKKAEAKHLIQKSWLILAIFRPHGYFDAPSVFYAYEACSNRSPRSRAFPSVPFTDQSHFSQRT